MPIQDRKFYIMKHNQEQEEHKPINSNKNGSVISGEAINTYASITQKNIKNRTSFL